MRRISGGCRKDADWQTSTDGMRLWRSCKRIEGPRSVNERSRRVMVDNAARRQRMDAARRQRSIEGPSSGEMRIERIVIEVLRASVRGGGCVRRGRATITLGRRGRRLLRVAMELLRRGALSADTATLRGGGRDATAL